MVRKSYESRIEQNIFKNNAPSDRRMKTEKRGEISFTKEYKLPKQKCYIDRKKKKKKNTVEIHCCKPHGEMFEVTVNVHT